MSRSGGPAAILGGSFDPIHLGHLQIARTVQQRLGLDRVLLLPAPHPPHKDPTEMAPAEHREAMVRLALPPEAGWEVCRHELERETVSYTIDTLRELRSQGIAEPVFILGMDSLVQLASWRNHRDLLTEFDLAVVDREGSSTESARLDLAEEIGEHLVSLPNGNSEPLRDVGSGGRIFHVPMEPIRISSSRIRQRASEGRSLDNLVPHPVARYIRTHRLYRRTEESTLSNQPPQVLVESVEAALDKKACDVQVLDLRGLSDVTDYFLICHGTSDRQAAAIADSVEERLRKNLKVKPVHVEGRQTGEWILMDYIDFVVHIFVEEKRDFYRLDRLWGDAPVCDLGSASSATDSPESASGPA